MKRRRKENRAAPSLSGWGALSLCLGLLLLCACGAAESAGEAAESGSASPAAETASPAEPGALIVSEVMTHNAATLMDEDGEFPDWIELENVSGHDIELEGYSLSDGDRPGWALPRRTLGAGERLLIFASGKDRSGAELHADFSLSDGETVTLFDSRGEAADQLLCPESGSDYSAYRNAAGEIILTCYPSPGFENSAAGYEAWQETLAVTAPLMISEAMSSNDLYEVEGEYCDWVELKNISGGPVKLSDYYLSDKFSNLHKSRLPDVELAAGASYVVRCNGETGEGCAAFQLSAEGERLYLSDENGVVDYLPLVNVPHNCSFGRLSGQNGGFLFSRPTPGAENRNGCRRVSETPSALTAPGVYNGVGSVSVELADTDAAVYYTLDGSLPDESSEVYRGAVALKTTTVFRAVAVEEGCLPSSAVTLNYIINENHTLPVLCLCADAPEELTNLLFKSTHKDVELSANLSFYEEEGSFSKDCGVSMSGVMGSLTLPKKSFKIHFRGKYGGSTLYYDVFDRKVQEFSSLTIRAGQDAYAMMFKNELWQDLFQEMDEDALSMYSRFCVLYINGSYMGIYALKEDLSREYYASHAGVKDADSVETQKFPVETDSEFFREIIRWCEDADLSDDANYAHFCEMVDIDSFIDWFIIEGESANVDLYRNIRVFRSPETGNRWCFAFFDVDLTKDSYTAPFSVLFGHSEMLSEHISAVVWAACENAQFVDALLTRYAEVQHTVFSNENILRKMDEFETALAPEMQREADRWHGGETKWWYENMEAYRRMITEFDWENCCVDNLLRYLNIYHALDAPVAEVRARYFE